MPITSNSVYNNRNQSGNMNTPAAKRTFRPGNSTITIREGETLKGVVSDIHGKEITLSMDDGSSFTGKLPEASQYSIGQKAAFLITGIDGGTIYMKAISQAYLLGMEDTIEQALEEAGLPKSPRNLEIVRSLLLNQQSISRENIANSLHLCAKYPDADVNSVITMKRLGFPMDPATVTQFDQYSNNTHQLLYGMDSVADSINDLLSGLGKQSATVARYAANEVLKTALCSLPSLEEYNLSTSQLQAETTETPDKTADNSDDPANPEISEESPMTETAASPFARMKQLFSGITDHNSTSVKSASSTDSWIPEQTGHLLSAEERHSLADTLRSFIDKEDFLASLDKGDLTARELLTQIKDSLATITDEDLPSLLSQKGFQKALKGQFLSGWTLSPEGLKEEGSIHNLYNRIQQQLSELANLSQMFDSQEAGKSILTGSSELQQNMEFMKMLNEQFSYMQLPLKLSQENAHGDLYVMTRKNTLKKSGAPLKVLLHLEMNSLGTLDIHITKEHTNVATRFYTAKDSTRKLLEKNAELLKDSINKQGFAFSSEFLPSEKELDLVHDFIENESPAPAGNVTRYNFDLRA